MQNKNRIWQNALSVSLILLAQTAICQPLIEAVKRHDLEKVRTILSTHVDINLPGSDGLTPLLVAVRTWDVAICKELLDHGANPNGKSDSTITPLMEASFRGSFDIVETLLKKGADVNISARIYAGSDGEMLSNSRLTLARPSTKIEWVEKSPLTLAAEGANLSVVRLLLEHGADINQQAVWSVATATERYSVKGRTPLMCAVENRFSGLVRLLLEKKADVTLQEWATAASGTGDLGDGQALRDPVAATPLFVKHSTALHIAAERCDRSSVDLLLGAGAEREARDGTNSTPLITAIRNGCTPVAEFLIERGADVNAEKNTPLSPLIQAAGRGRLRLVELLIKAGASVDQKAGENFMPLVSWGVLGGNRQVVRTLLEHGADMNGTTSDHWTPLMIAARDGEANIVRLLIASKAKINLRNDAGQTALIVAARKGHGECVQALLGGGADDQVRDGNGKTALALAMEEGDQKIVRLFREGAAASAKVPPTENERLSDLLEYFSNQIDAHYYSESHYLALSKPYGKWDIRPLHIASFPHPDGEGNIGSAEVPEFVWEVVAHHDFNVPLATAQNVRNQFVREGFAHKERYCKNFYLSRRAAFEALCLQAGQNSRSIYLQQRDPTAGEVYDRVDNVYRQNRMYWRYLVPSGSPFQMSPRIDTLHGYQYTSSDESILQGLYGTGCYCLVKVNGYIVFMTGGVLDNSIGFIYGKTRPKRGSLGPLFNLALLEDLGDGFYYYVSN